MTVEELSAILAYEITAGHGKKQVVVSKETFVHPLEADGCTILPVEKAEMATYPIMDGDGWPRRDPDGSETFRENLVLSGG